MFKMLFGAAVVVALVGYGVITTDDVQQAGNEVRRGINTVLQKGADATRDPSIADMTRDTIEHIQETARGLQNDR